MSKSVVYNLIYADPPWRQSKGGKKSVRPKSSGEELDLSEELIELIVRYRPAMDKHFEKYRPKNVAGNNHNLPPRTPRSSKGSGMKSEGRWR